MDQLAGWATLALAVATTLSVCFTAKMARKTADLAESNEKIIDQNERHHIIDIRPIVIIESKFNLEIMENRKELLKSIPPTNWSEFFPGISSNFALINFESNKSNIRLVNIGKGIALNPSMLIRFEDSSLKELEADFSPIPTGLSLPLQVVAFMARLESHLINSNKHFKWEEYGNLLKQPWQIFIKYYDIYGNVYYTQHAKESSQRWTILSKRGEDIPPGKSRSEIEAGLAALTTENHSINSLGI